VTAASPPSCDARRADEADAARSARDQDALAGEIDPSTKTVPSFVPTTACIIISTAIATI
jgi:hypothetical protein